MNDYRDDNRSNRELAGAGAGRRNDVSRRTAIGSVTGLALASSSSSLSGTADTDRTGAEGRQADRRGIASPEHHGAVGDGLTDDTTALQAAFDTGCSVELTAGKTYLIAASLRLSADDVTVTGGGRIKVSRSFDLSSDRDGNGTHMRALFVTGTNATVTGVSFDATDAPVGSAVENGFIWSQAPFTTIRDCLFLGNRKGTCVWGRGDAAYMSVQGCRFQRCSGAVFAKGRNTIIMGNIIIDATDAAIAINGRSCVGAVVADNTISNESLAPIPSMIAVEESASSWTISGNTLIGVNGGGIVCTNILDATRVKAGVIANNVIDARSFDGRIPYNKNPSAMIAISDSYLNWIVSGNTITACSKGNSNSRLAIVAASGGMFHDNIFDARYVEGLSATIEISAGTEGIVIRNNKTEVTPEGRHYLFGAGEYGLPCQFWGGWMLGGQEGINGEINAKKSHRLVIEINDIDENTAKNIVNAYSLMGDRCGFLNAGAWARPHRVGRRTEMYAVGVPQDAGTTPFQVGDRFHFMNPETAEGSGVVRTASGWMRS